MVTTCDAEIRARFMRARNGRVVEKKIVASSFVDGSVIFTATGRRSRMLRSVIGIPVSGFISLPISVWNSKGVVVGMAVAVLVAAIVGVSVAAGCVAVSLVVAAFIRGVGVVVVSSQAASASSTSVQIPRNSIELLFIPARILAFNPHDRIV